MEVRKTTKRLYLIPVLSKALDILELMQVENQPMTLEAIHRQTRISKTTVYRVLKTFVHRGYLSQSPDGLYRQVTRPKKLRFGFGGQSADMPFSVEVTESLKDAAASVGVEVAHTPSPACRREKEDLVEATAAKPAAAVGSARAATFSSSKAPPAPFWVTARSASALCRAAAAVVARLATAPASATAFPARQPDPLVHRHAIPGHDRLRRPSTHAIHRGDERPAAAAVRGDPAGAARLQRGGVAAPSAPANVWGADLAEDTRLHVSANRGMKVAPGDRPLA